MAPLFTQPSIIVSSSLGLTTCAPGCTSQYVRDDDLGGGITHVILHVCLLFHVQLDERVAQNREIP